MIRQFHRKESSWNVCSMDRKFHGSESSLYGLFAPWNESAEERKGLESESRPQSLALARMPDVFSMARVVW